MLAFALSLLFGLIALAALIEIHASAVMGVRRGRQIHAELAQGRKPAFNRVAAERSQWMKPARAVA